jgi:D-3-phosphoglycerate dehydrogenase
VFKEEPATENPLFNLPNVVATPHLGASTTEAQENVALQVAEQMSDYLLTGAVSNALNMPSVTAEEAAVMGPWLKLAEHLGAFVGQLTDEPIEAIDMVYNGVVTGMNLNALNCAADRGRDEGDEPGREHGLRPVIARERGIELSTTTQDKSGVFDGYIRLVVKTEHKTRSIAGTVFSDGKPRFIQIKGINIDAEIGEHMLYTTNEDVPGIIGTLGQTMGENGVNIANFTLGRSARDGEAIALLYLDEQPPAHVLDKLKATGMFQQVRTLQFDCGLTRSYARSHWTRARCAGSMLPDTFGRESPWTISSSCPAHGRPSEPSAGRLRASRRSPSAPRRPRPRWSGGRRWRADRPCRLWPCHQHRTARHVPEPHFGDGGRASPTPRPR